MLVAEVEGFKQTVVDLTKNIGVPTQETVKPKDNMSSEGEVELANSDLERIIRAFEGHLQAIFTSVPYITALTLRRH